MNLLCTFPGKFGDLLWALPTIRAISRRIDQPVELAVAKPLESICALIALQPYIDACYALDWRTLDTAPISPRVPDILPQRGSYDVVLHLGYTGWPLPDLARHTRDTANVELIYNVDACGPGYHPKLYNYREPVIIEEELDLETPWITVHPMVPRCPWVYGFTDEYFELKYGLVQLLSQGWRRGSCSAAILPPNAVGSNARWIAEAGEPSTDWVMSAALIQQAGAFLGCCSALHVLAVACGTPVVMMEPQSMRHNATFYPLGKVGPQVHLVTGTDGLPTFDARHVADVLETTLVQVGR